MISFMIIIAFICSILNPVHAETIEQQATHTKNAHQKDDIIHANQEAYYGSSNGRCHDSDWIPYKEEKCFKMLHTTYETQTYAKKTCKSLSAPGSTLVSINSHEEAAFLQELFINSSNHQSSKFWIGLERINNSSDFVWPNGIILSTGMHSNWASGHPAHDGKKKCVELDFNSNNFKLKVKNQLPYGLWYNVRCANLNLVICESRQQPTLYDIQSELTHAELEIKYLRELLEKFHWEIEEQKYESIQNDDKIVTLKKDINSNTHELKNQDKQFVTISKDVKQTAKNLEENDKQFSDVNGQIQRNIKMLDEKDKQLESIKDKVEQLTDQLSKKEQQLKTVEGKVEENMKNLQDRHKEIENLNEKIMKSNRKLEENDKQISALKDKVQNSKLQIEEKEKQIDVLNEKVKQNNELLSCQGENINLMNQKVITVDKELNQTNFRVYMLTSKVDKNTQTMMNIEELAVTDIRFGSPEVANMARAPGFNEAEGYVITGVVNEDRDVQGIIDKVSRRKLEIKRNGRWSRIKFY